VVSSAAFQAAGAAEVPFQGFRLLPAELAGTYESRRSQGAWGEGIKQE